MKCEHKQPEYPAEQLLNYLKAPGYIAQDVSAIARGMGVDSRERAALRELLRQWELEGKIVRLSKARFVLRKPAEEQLRGRIRRIKPGKFLFVADSAGQELLRSMTHDECAGIIELPVMPHRDGGAMDGDFVAVSLRRSCPQSYHRRRRGRQRPEPEQLVLEVRVDELLERRHDSWVGIYRPGGRFGILVGDGKTAPEQVFLTTPPPPELLAGMAITAQVDEYPRGKMPARAHIAEVLGWPDDRGVDITTIMYRYALRDSFPPAVLAEATALSENIPQQVLAEREDWRSACVITIDPATARDFDDAISLRELPDGSIELAVHIADVSYYVRPGSALDTEAALRGNSTYLPDRVLPMLPPRLCDDLCSLRPGEDRLTRLCVMKLNRKGEVFHSRFADAVIRSRARLSYEQALEVIERRASSGSPEIDRMLQLGHRAAQLLRKRRLEQGALDLEIPELHVLLDEKGRPYDVSIETGDDAHHMIEEFMLAANEAVARALKAALVPAIYRVHEEPDPAKLQSFAHTAAGYGLHTGNLQSRAALSHVVEKIKEHQDSHILTSALLRSMMRARYATRALGHFGLAKGDYCHFTSPIRRYADLIIHRSFTKLTQGKHAKVSLPPPARLAEIAEHISETERNSAAAEHEAQQTKLAQFLADECEKEHPRPWSAVISDCYPQGMAVEVPQLQMQGFISGAELSDAFGARWFFEPHARRWSSTDGRFYLPGQSIDVIPVQVDSVSRFIDFAPYNEK